jgi:hypothetical protein
MDNIRFSTNTQFFSTAGNASVVCATSRNLIVLYSKLVKRRFSGARCYKTFFDKNDFLI